MCTTPYTLNPHPKALPKKSNYQGWPIHNSISDFLIHFLFIASAHKIIQNENQISKPSYPKGFVGKGDVLD